MKIILGSKVNDYLYEHDHRFKEEWYNIDEFHREFPVPT